MHLAPQLLAILVLIGPLTDGAPVDPPSTTSRKHEETSSSLLPRSNQISYTDSPSKTLSKPKKTSDAPPPQSIETAPPIDVPGGHAMAPPGYPIETSNPQLRAKVDPSFFYDSEELLILCDDPEEVLERGEARWNLHDTGLGGAYFRVYNEIWGNDRGLTSERGKLVLLSFYLHMCTLCNCEEDYLLSVEPQGCDEEAFVKLCQEVFHCYCAPTLTNPIPTATDVSVWDYQQAIWGLTKHIAKQDRDWKWTNGPRHKNGPRPAFYFQPGDEKQTDSLGTLGSEPEERWLVPGTNEPYYLEGPTKHRGPLDVFGGLVGLGSESSSFTKRDGMESEIEVRETDERRSNGEDFEDKSGYMNDNSNKGDTPVGN
ncbi:hypothetical protein TWF281_005317 [Arthrobotrys megalospora]